MSRIVSAWRALMAPKESKAVDLSALVSAPSSAGVTVNDITALRSSAVYACVRHLSETIASLPVHLHRRDRSGKRSMATGHPVDKIIRVSPNINMTSFEFWRYAVLQATALGSFYAEIIRSPRGDISQLIPLPTRNVRVEQLADYSLLFHVTDFRGQSRKLRSDQMFRFSGLSANGITGIFTYEVAREAIGLALAAEKYAAGLFRNGGRPTGVLTMPGKLNGEEIDQVRESWASVYGGANNANKTAILEFGLKYEPIAPTNKDSQVLESRQQQIRDIARYFGIQPHLIGDLSDATYSNIEAQSREHVQYALAPRLRNIEDAISRDLLGYSDNLFAKFSVGGLLRGDSEARAKLYAASVQWGWRSRNEIRELEDLDPKPGLDEPLTPLNMTPQTRREGDQ